MSSMFMLQGPSEEDIMARFYGDVEKVMNLSLTLSHVAQKLF